MTVYNPRYFASDDQQAIRRVLMDYGFATLITRAREEVVVSHVPVLWEEGSGLNGCVVGHVARANPHVEALGQGPSFLMFQGPFGYVSPTWYTDPSGSVPTWNYVAIHIHGSIERLDGLADKRAIVDALSARHEAALPRPWTSAKMNAELLQKMLGAIVGFRMIVERIDAKFKLSQNRGSEDRAGVIAGLEEQGSPAGMALAAWMREYSKPS